MGEAGSEEKEDLKREKNKMNLKRKNEIFAQLEGIKRKFQQNWQKIPQSVQEQELQQIAIAFAYNTNAIEGSTITLQETREIIEDKIAPRKPLRDIKETENHAKVFLEMLQSKQEITPELLLQWHYGIFKDTKPEIAGKYRDYHVRVGIYRAPDWQDVILLMNKLREEIKQIKEINSVEASARIHYRFEKIHLFGDGNGRIGRLLMNYMLWHNQYPMLITEKKKRRAYYNALEKTEEYFCKYFIRTYLKAHKK